MARLTMRCAAIIAWLLIALSAHAETGTASVYGGDDHECGKPVAAGGMLDCRGYTAAYPSLPFGTTVKVTNAANGRSLAVRINDRGPHIKGRIIDLTPAVAAAIGCPGLCSVVVEIISGWVPTSNDLFRGAQ